MSLLLFWLFSTVMLIGGVSVIAFRNPVSSALSVVTCFVGLAGLFIGLSAFFVGVIQILVYTGAVMMLFLFVLMLIGVDSGNFWSVMQDRVDVWRDVGNGIIKSAVFGVICTAVALYQGYETEATPEGVAYATTRTVVVASLSVLGLDFILTAMMFSI